MKSLIKIFFKSLILTFVVLCISWFGLKFYFNHDNIIANQVRGDVITQVQANHSQFLTYNDIPKMYRNAIIATEDRSFFTNRGIDFRGMLYGKKDSVCSRTYWSRAR